MRATVLCVDGDGARRADTVRTLTSATPEGTALTGVATVGGVRETVEEGQVDCVVTEYDLPDGTGMDVANVVRERRPDAACVLYTATPYDEVDTTDAEQVIVEFVPRDRPESELELGTLVDSLLRFRTHTAYPLPPDERDRVASAEAYRPVADDASRSLNRLSEIAAAHFETSLTYVTLMLEHEQVLLEQVGETPPPLAREDSVCTYTLLEDGVTVIEDLASDPLFGANDAVAGMGLRFYAGAKLVSPDDHVVGTFCVMDDEPRSLSDSDRAVLAALGEEAMEQLELRRRLAARTGVSR